MIKRKMMISLIIIFTIIFTFLFFYYPAQRILALKKFDKYSKLQGVQKKNIDSKEISKNLKIGGYTIVVNYKNDSKHEYKYQYFPITNRKHEDIKFHRMYCDIIDLDEDLVLEPPYDNSVKYPSLGYQ